VAIISGLSAIASVSADNTLKIWTKKGELYHTFQTGTPQITCIASPCSQYVITGGTDGVLKFWDLSSRSLKNTFNEHAPHIITTSALAPNGRWLVTADNNGQLILWALNRLVITEQRRLSFNVPVMCCDFSKNSDRFVVCTEDGKISEYNILAQALRPVAQHDTMITSCSYALDDAYLLCSTRNGDDHDSVFFYQTNIDNFQQPQRFITRDSGFADDFDTASVLTYGSMSGSGNFHAGMPAAASTPDRAARARDRSVSIISVIPQVRTVPGIALLRFVYTRPIHQQRVHNAAINQCAFSPNGLLATSASNDGLVRLWNITTGLEVRNMTGHKGAVSTCIYSHNGNFIVSGAEDKTLRFRTQYRTYSLHGHTEAVTCCAFSANDQWLVSGDENGELRLWNTKMPTSFSGKITHIPSDNNVLNPRVRRGIPVEGRVAAAVKSCCFNNDGTKILTGWNNGDLAIYDTTSARTSWVGSRAHQGPISSCAYSPDNRYFISAGHKDHIIKIWNTETKELIAQLNEHQADINSCAYSSNGKYIISASSDETVKIWDVSAIDRQQIQRVANLKHTGLVTSAAFSPYQQPNSENSPPRFIISGTSSGVLTIWDRCPQSGHPLMYDSSSSFFSMFRQGHVANAA
jgi:WD40 repeat protein